MLSLCQLPISYAQIMLNQHKPIHDNAMFVIVQDNDSSDSQLSDTDFHTPKVKKISSV